MYHGCGLDAGWGMGTGKHGGWQAGLYGNLALGKKKTFGLYRSIEKCLEVTGVG